MTDIYDRLSAAQDDEDAATQAIDAATTDLAAQLAALADRVKADDLASGELEALVDRASASAAKLSDFATNVAASATAAAGIEPTPQP